MEDNKQKPKNRWFTIGDDCKKFFHAKMSMRRHINNMNGLLNGDMNSHDD